MAAYLANPVLPGASPSFAFEPIYVHPGHQLEVPDWPEASLDTSDYEEYDELPMMNDLDISDAASPPARRGSDLDDVSESDASPWFTESPSPYFGSYEWPSSSSISSDHTGLFEQDSPSSSRSSTPTPESPMELKAKLPDATRSPPPLAVSSFFFNSASPHLRSSSRSLPTTPNHGGAMMQRSFSLPVEQEHILQDRLSRRSSLHTAANVMSPSLCRSPSSSGFGAGWMSPPAPGGHRGVGLARRGSEPTGAGLGFSVPQQSTVHLAFDEKSLPASAPLSTYPYNIASPRRSRMNRSHSTPDVPTTFHIPIPQGKSSSSGTSSPSPRSRRPTLKMTPITPDVATF
ncbi:hypothetical protein RQP46_003035 [Phenoliferia psychrophenolica]